MACVTKASENIISDNTCKTSHKLMPLHYIISLPCNLYLQNGIICMLHEGGKALRGPDGPEGFTSFVTDPERRTMIMISIHSRICHLENTVDSSWDMHGLHAHIGFSFPSLNVAESTGIAEAS